MTKKIPIAALNLENWGALVFGSNSHVSFKASPEGREA
jgi:hypothetical protein